MNEPKVTQRFLPVDLLVLSELNPNRMTEEEFGSLVESMKNAGFLEANPILARPISDGAYEIVDGEHRWRAAKELGIELVPCNIRDMDDLEADRHRVILNKDRGVLDYFKLSILLNRNYEPYNHNGMTQERLGELFGFSQPSIANLLPIYSRLRNYLHVNTFSNRDLLNLARVGSDLLREWLVEASRDEDSKWIEKKATLCNELYDYVTGKVSVDKVQLVLDEARPHLFEWPLTTLKDEVDRLVEEYLRTWRVICGDAFQELQKLVEEGQLVDLVVTDPPYNISGPNKVMKREGEIVEADIAEWDHQTTEEYEQFVRDLLSEIAAVLKPTGSFYVFLDKAFSGRSWFMAEETGLKPRNIVHWVKTNPTPHARKNNYLSAVEHILFGTKSDEYTFNFTNDNEMHNVYRCPVAGGEERAKYPSPTAKPVELIEHLIRVSSRVNDTVLDCFAGRGTTGNAALKQKRNCILIESNPAYCKTVERWITSLLGGGT
jgi:site-specific DNA-methyltransferase (adenine-specific)/modification methylase